MVKHESRWLAPTPLWGGGAALGETFKRPAILRFDNDAFMEEFMSLLDSAPERLQGWVAKAETWRKPMSKDSEKNDADNTPDLLSLLRRSRGLPTAPPVLLNKSELEGADISLKLYQPAQQRFYLISAALVCNTAGLPDKQVNTGEQEKVSFVLRRMFGEHEYAFTAKGKGFEWQKIEPGKEKTVNQAEEQLPLFNLNYQQSADKKRRVLAGLIPVARREAYLGAVLTSSGIINQADVDEYSPLQLLFQTQVVAPWKSLIQQAEIQKALFDETFPPIQGPADPDYINRRNDAAAILKVARESIQTISWYILLDFADFLKTYIPEVLRRIKGETTNLSTDETALFNAIANIQLDVSGFSLDAYPGSYSVETNLMAVLQIIQEYRTGLESVDVPYSRESSAGSKESGWPNFLYPLTDPETLSFDANGDVDVSHIDNLAALIVKLLPVSGDNFPDLEALKINKDNANNVNFVIRCVYAQPLCEPMHMPVLSDRSEEFEMAAFFDPDAPARPIRIPMPMDISPAGLRKYQKNTSLIISDMLCGKISKIKKLTLADLVLSILPWPFHKDLPNVNDTGPCGKEDSNNFGIICSLSIPIVTLVALILMIIMVTLFDIFFKWIPYLFMCLPIPGLSGKNKP